MFKKSHLYLEKFPTENRTNRGGWAQIGAYRFVVVAQLGNWHLIRCFKKIS